MTEQSNLVAACRPCNDGKSSKVVDAPPVPRSSALTAVRVGRPPLNHVRVPIRLPQQAIDEIDAMVGTYGRAGFIREAVERELKRRKS